MKKLMLILAILGFVAFGNVSTALAQSDDPLATKDTLSIDDMDPVFYEAQQESGSHTTTIIIVAVAVVVVGGAAFYIIKKKKKQ